MDIHDRVYGNESIKEPAVLALIQSKPFQRLKKINQAGASQYLFPWKNISRYEHSIGVFLLLRKYGANLAEQIAGLLHDLPHTAFSHVIDYVYENEHHEYHEQFHEDIIENSEIAEILKNNNIPKTVANPEKFGLLEKNLPDLCADRIDYALRDFSVWKKDPESISAKLMGLTVVNNEFVFENIYAAESFARDYLEVDRENWANPREIAVYLLLAQAIRHALDRQILKHDDLFTDDEKVMQILKKDGDPYIHKKLAYLTPEFRIEEASKNHHHLYVKTKVRYVDPKVKTQGKLQRLSEASKDYKKLLLEHIARMNKGWYIFIYPK